MVDGGNADNAQTETKKKQKVRPAARRMSWRLNPNDISRCSAQVIMVSDPSLSNPKLAAFVVHNRPAENCHLTEFQVAFQTRNAP